MLKNDSKLISLEEAVALIPDGANCSFSGFSETNNPMSFVRQMIRAGKKPSGSIRYGRRPVGGAAVRRGSR